MLIRLYKVVMMIIIMQSLGLAHRNRIIVTKHQEEAAAAKSLIYSLLLTKNISRIHSSLFHITKDEMILLSSLQGTTELFYFKMSLVRIQKHRKG